MTDEPTPTPEEEVAALRAEIAELRALIEPSLQEKAAMEALPPVPSMPPPEVVHEMLWGPMLRNRDGLTVVEDPQQPAVIEGDIPDPLQEGVDGSGS